MHLSIGNLIAGISRAEAFRDDDGRGMEGVKVQYHQYITRANL
jgi:hypothetical protein